MASRLTNAAIAAPNAIMEGETDKLGTAAIVQNLLNVGGSSLNGLLVRQAEHGVQRNVANVSSVVVAATAAATTTSSSTTSATAASSTAASSSSSSSSAAAAAAAVELTSNMRLVGVGAFHVEVRACAGHGPMMERKEERGDERRDIIDEHFDDSVCLLVGCGEDANGQPKEL